MAAMVLRLMQLVDLASVNALLIRAFSAARQEEGYHRSEISLCRQEFLRYYLLDTPESCWVAADGEQICGVVFGHALGSTGWIGPLAVFPERQNRGLGQALLRHSIGALRASGCSLLGLETDAASLHNLAFYSRLGFIPGPILADLTRSADSGWESAPDRFVKNYSQHPGLFDEHLPSFLRMNGIEADYLHLARRLRQGRFGESYLELVDGQPHCFTALQLVPVSVREASGVGRCMAIVAPRGSGADEVEGFLLTVASMAECSHLVVRVPLWQHVLLHEFLRRGWRLVHSHLRFYISGCEAGEGGVHLNKWD